MEAWFENDRVKLYHADVVEALQAMPAESVHCCLTSPPYWSLRDYGTAEWVGGDPGCDHRPATLHHDRNEERDRLGDSHATNSGQLIYAANRVACEKCGAVKEDKQIGLEPTFGEFIERMVGVFDEVRRVLRKDGTCWVNMGESWSCSPNGRSAADTKALGNDDRTFRDKPDVRPAKGPGLEGTAQPGGVRRSFRSDGAECSPAKNRQMREFKNKDMIGQGWALAFALRDAGWWLRDCVIWCLAPSTRVYARTQKGEGPHDLRDLMRLDPSTVQLWNGERWTRVLGWSETRCEDPLRIVLRSGEALISTPAHEWPLADGRLVRAGDLRLGDVLATTQLPEPDGGVTIDPDLAWFAGLYLAEGSRSGDHIQLSGHKDEAERMERVARVARRYGGSTFVAARDGGNGVNQVVHGSILEGAVRHFIAGQGAHGKHIQPRVWNCSDETLRALLEGYLDGDGCWEQGNRRWRLGFCRNTALADDLRTLAARLGATLTLNPRLAKMGRTRVFESYQGELRWERNGHGNEKARSEVVEIVRGWPGEFIDVGVEDDPHLFALASGVLTHNSKGNPMPSSVTDRTTMSHEYLFLLAKSPRYYFDWFAIRERAVCTDPRKGKVTGRGQGGFAHAKGDDRDQSGGFPRDGEWRNRRSVWEVNTQPSMFKHYATFPRDLVRPVVMAGTSERGCCAACGKPYERIVRKSGGNTGKDWLGENADKRPERGTSGCMRADTGDGSCRVESVGWKRTCKCTAVHAEPVPCTMLDPFSGTATTGEVALQLGRRYVGIELNLRSCEDSKKRLLATAVPIPDLAAA